jgi:hypothetical protein
MVSVENNCDSGQQWWQTTTVVDNNGMQDSVADYDGEGQERAARDGRDSGVAMMAAAAEDGGGGQRQQRRTTTAADNNGAQGRAADYDGEGRERVANNNGIRHKASGAHRAANL